MAKIAKPPVPAKMYRHFAIITVAITALMALMADGESREAISDGIEQHQQELQADRAAARRATGAELSIRDGATLQSRGGGGGGDEGGSFGAPSMQVKNSGASIAVSGTNPMSAEMRVLPGYSSEYLNSLTEDEYRKLQESLRAQGLLSAEQRAQTLGNLERQSARRAGPSSRSE